MPRPVVPIFLSPAAASAGMVKGDVVRHDEGGIGGDAQTLLNVGHADGVEFVDFAEEGFRREDDAVAR